MCVLETGLSGVDDRLNTVGGKVDGLAVELKEHRSDTEAHHGIYRVKEG